MSKFNWFGRSALAAAVAMPMVLSAPMKAEAGGEWSPGAAVALGVVGGLALGAAISDHRDYYDYDARYYRHRHVVYYPRAYYDDEPSCYRVRERVYVPGYGWDYRRRTVCD